MRNPADRLVCGACGAVTEVQYIPNAAANLAECRRVMEQALEALPLHYGLTRDEYEKRKAVVAALRKALGEQG